MAALPSSRVYQGFWIDYTRGPILGSTITTSSKSGNTIIAVLSVLVAFTGAHLWDLIAFIRYCRGVSKSPCSALHHQVQILARNITSPGAFLLEVTKVGWAWRRHGSLSSLISAATLALVCSVGFLIAGVFVSQIVAPSGLRVLVHSDSCGWLSWRNESTPQNQEYQQLVFSQAVTYSELCYNKTSPLSQCNIYVKQAAPIEQKTYTSCPFPNICTNNTAVRLDTGLLDSNDMFGINTDLNLRVKMQRVLTCAPLDADRYFTTRPMPPDYMRRIYNREVLPDEQLLELSLGRLTASLAPFNSTVWQSNYTPVFSLGPDLT
jgi:hypothetical protein